MTIRVLHHWLPATQCAKGSPLYLILNPKIPTKHWENKDHKGKSRGSKTLLPSQLERETCRPT